MKYIIYSIDIIKIIFCEIIGFLMKFNKKYSDIWLIGERGSEAKDTGYHLYKYIRENHPEKRIFYIIEKKIERFR